MDEPMIRYLILTKQLFVNNCVHVHFYQVPQNEKEQVHIKSNLSFSPNTIATIHHQFNTSSNQSLGQSKNNCEFEKTFNVSNRTKIMLYWGTLKSWCNATFQKNFSLWYMLISTFNFDIGIFQKNSPIFSC